MYYTIGTSILSASTMPLGLIMGRDKIHFSQNISFCHRLCLRHSPCYPRTVSETMARLSVRILSEKDKHGCRIMRLIGIIIFFLSTILFTFISWYPSDLSWAVLPAVAMNGVGGIIYVFTSFQLGLYSFNSSNP